MLSELNYSVLRASIMEAAEKGRNAGESLRIMADGALMKHRALKRKSAKEAELFEAIFRVCMETELIAEGFKRDIYAAFTPYITRDLAEKYECFKPRPEPSKHKKYAKKTIGFTDIAEAIIRAGESGTHSVSLGGDGPIFARVIPGKVELPSYYDLLYTESAWLWIYDDTGRKLSLWPADNAQRMEVWKAGRSFVILNAKEVF